MKKLTHVSIALLLLLLSFVATSAANSSPAMEATLALPFETVLPGVPVDMTVTFKNLSKSAASAGLSAMLTVALPDGRTLSPRTHLLLDPHSPASHPDTCVTLEAGESRQFYMLWTASAVMWCHGGEYTGPGTYGLTLQLEGEKGAENYVGTITTNTARLTRTVPLGEDEAIWKRMSTAIDGHWADDGLFNSQQGPAILRDILELHPASGYYPYALLLSREFPLRPGLPTEDAITKALAAADRFESSPAYPHLLLVPGEMTLSLAYLAADNHDRKLRIEYLERTAAFSEAVLAKTSQVAARSHAETIRRRARSEIERELQRRPAIQK